MVEIDYKHHLEYRRQLWHLFFGLVLVYMARFFPGIGYFYLSLSILGFVLSFSFRDYIVNSIFIRGILIHLERDDHKTVLPGKGLIFYLLGSGIVLIFFPLNIALFGITLLAVGDSLSHLIGRFFGTIKFPWNERKNIEGSIFAAILCALAGSVFVRHEISITVSIVVMLLESIPSPPRYWWYDDNYLIPIAAAVLAYNFNYLLLLL